MMVSIIHPSRQTPPIQPAIPINILPTILGQRKGSFFRTTPKREPLSRLWFLARGFKKANPDLTGGNVIWLHPVTNDVLNQYGQKLSLQIVPYEKFKANTTRYLKLSIRYGNMYLAQLKYLTFKGEIKPGEEIDHIDGNTLNNNIRNLRAVPSAINRRDGGFMRKLRNNKIYVAMYPGIILEGYERMAQYKKTHTACQYKHLKGDDLLKVFLGDKFVIVDPLAAAAEEPARDIDIFVERD